MGKVTVDTRELYNTLATGIGEDDSLVMALDLMDAVIVQQDETITARDATILELRGELAQALAAALGHEPDFVQTLVDELIGERDQAQAAARTARESRARLVQLVRSFVEIRKTLGNVAGLGRERDQLKDELEKTRDELRAAVELLSIREEQIQDEIGEARWENA